MKFVDMILMIYNMNINKKQPLLFIYWRIINIFVYFFYISSVLYVFGFVNNYNAKIYLNYIDDISKIIVSLFLMWKFNMFRSNIYFSDLDRSVVFQCALFLFLTTALNQILVYNLINVKNKVLDKNNNYDLTKRVDNVIGTTI